MEGRKRDGRLGEGTGKRSVTYCLIPFELASELHDVLRQHFAARPDVEVLVERRGRERRTRGERRQRPDGPPAATEERRRIRGVGGRRAGERRATVARVEPLPLPGRARRHAHQLIFIKRSGPSTDEAEDLDTAGLVNRVQSGDREAFGALYSRYFDRVYGYLRVLLRNSDEAEDGAQQVFTKALEALGRYERRSQPFRAWLFTLVRNYALGELRKQARVKLENHAHIERRRERAASQEPKLPGLGWVSDRRLLLLIESLPSTQRQVLTLRYMMDLTNREVAEVLGLSPSSVKVLHYRAMRFLRERMDLPAADPTSHRGKGIRAT